MKARLLLAVMRAVSKLFGGTACVPVDFPGKPIPASRPRVTRQGRAYYAKTYRNWRRSAQQRLTGASLPAEPMTGPIGVVMEIVYPYPKSGTHREWPQGDNDNYEKASWDVATQAGVIQDDDQIVANLTVKRYTERQEQEGVFLWFYQLPFN